MSLEKPAKGTAQKARKARARAQDTHESREMKAARVRDLNRCRNPACTFRDQRYVVDPCHQTHRGMGGNPAGDRTVRKLLICLCRGCHDLYDAGKLLIDALDEVKQFDGRVSFRSYDPKKQSSVLIGWELRDPYPQLLGDPHAGTSQKSE